MFTQKTNADVEPLYINQIFNLAQAKANNKKGKHSVKFRVRNEKGNNRRKGIN